MNFWFAYIHETYTVWTWDTSLNALGSYNQTERLTSNAQAGIQTELVTWLVKIVEK